MPGVTDTDKSSEFSKTCEDLLWNHDKSTHIDPKRMESPNERSEELKKGLRLYQSSQDQTNSSGGKQWYVIVICETFTIYSQMKNALHKEIRHSSQWADDIFWSIDFFNIQFPQETRTGFINSAQEYSTVMFVG